MLAFFTQHTGLFAWSFVIVELLIVVCIFLPKTKAVGFKLSVTFAITLIVTTQPTPGYPHDFWRIDQCTSNESKTAAANSDFAFVIDGSVYKDS